MTISASKRMRTLTVRAALATCFPKCFVPKGDTRKRPLKIGIRADLLAALPEIDPRDLRDTLIDYCQGPSYRAVLTAGAVRIDLEGNPAGEVTAEEAESAAESVATFEARGYRVNKVA